MKDLTGKHLPTNDGKTFSNVLTVNGLLNDNDIGTLDRVSKAFMNQFRNGNVVSLF